MSIGAPQVESARNLRPLCEIFEPEEDGNLKFLRSMFGLVTDDYIVYLGRSPIRKLKLTAKDINESLKHILDEEIYPEAPAHITAATLPEGDDTIFIKGPKLSSYDSLEGTGLLPKLLLQEVEILEVLRRNPHPNIVRYHGCRLRRGRIVGAVLDRYPITLQQRVKKGAIDFDMDPCMKKITSAVRHLHSLRLAHNDLNPMNIMLDERDSPFIIDIGSCQPFGQALITGGTQGWIDEEFTTSAQRNDEIALSKIQVWLSENTGQKTS